MLNNQRVEISQSSMISVDFPLFRPETREDSALGASHGDDRMAMIPDKNMRFEGHFLKLPYGYGSKPGTPGEPQNSWDLWMFIPLKMVLIGIDPWPYESYETLRKQWCLTTLL